MQISQPLKILIFALSFLFLYHSFHEVHRYLGYLKLMRSRDTLQKAVTKLEQEKIELSGEISKIKSSKSYAQKVLRDNFHLVNDEKEERIIFSD